MVYLYHIVPKNMKGNILYPLNRLKKVYPEVYKKQITKYVGRERIMWQKIIYLNCKWNDVIHLTPVNPSKINKTLLAIGLKLIKCKWYKINANILDPKKTVIYKYLSDKIPLPISDYEKYNPNKLVKYNKIPLLLKRYYSQQFKNKTKPLLFHLIPHVLYKGNIKVENLEIIKT